MKKAEAEVLKSDVGKSVVKTANYLQEPSETQIYEVEVLLSRFPSC